MRLNPQNCAFIIEVAKFLSFMLKHQGIKVNPDKRQTILEMKSPASVKEVQRLPRRIASLSRFMAASAQKALLFFSLFKKESTFEWMLECDVAFTEFKGYLSYPSMLSKLEIGKPLFLYISVSDVAITSALV